MKRRATRRAWLIWAIPCVMTLLLLGVLEVGVRLRSRKDPDGNVWIGWTRLRPFQLPIQQVTADIQKYQQSPQSSLIYDAELGWNQRPGVGGHNAAGFITTGEAPGKERTDGVRRIALFGDSFTQGRYDTGWWRVLEQQLNTKGVRAEVLNFAVSGYGMDQAWLRWKRDGAPYQPEIVIFGFFAEDCYRNVNTLRLLRDPISGIPFMKPRVIQTKDGLEVLNVPTPEPGQIATFLGSFPGSALAGHDYFFRPQDYQSAWWQSSRLVGLVEAKLRLAKEAASAETFFQLDGEGAQLTLAILRQMRKEVEATGAQFYLLHLPSLGDMQSMQRGGRFPHQHLYEQVRKEFTIVGVEDALMQVAQQKPLPSFFADGHYQPAFDAEVGRVAADAVQGWLKEK